MFDHGSPTYWGRSEPSDANIETARLLLEMHPMVNVPEAVCQFCFRPYPCADVRWANGILAAARTDGHEI